jgi:two-component system, NtrC family, sensor kinase
MIMRTFQDSPISQKLMISVVVTSGLAVLLASIAILGYQWVSSRDSMLQNLGSTMSIIGLNSTAAISFNDPVAAEQTLSALRAQAEIQLACIYIASSQEHPRYFAGFRRDGRYQRCPELPGVNQLSLSSSLLARTQTIVINDELIGYLYVERGLTDFWGVIIGYLLATLLAMLGSLLIAMLMSRFLQAFISRPILNLAMTTQQVSESKDYSIRVSRGGNDEIGQLIENFNDMLSQIGNRDHALQQARRELELRVTQTDKANAELKTTLERLRQTQEQLVQIEKMASLGGLVAGIAHEINTPIGVGVTAASTLKAKTDSLGQDYGNKTLTDSGLRRYIELAAQSSGIILTNLNRASELIQSFKQVAVDQSSSERRHFEIKPYLHEILLSLRPNLKKTRLSVNVICEDGLEINSYPGALAQIITNLVMNSIIHAYAPEQPGTLNIHVERRGGDIVLRYADDGKGMPPEHVSRVFDPFFTTRRGSGGSGLGMHIVFNLVTQQMGGTVTLKSELGKGTVVELKIPALEKTQHEQRQYANAQRR